AHRDRGKLPEAGHEPGMRVRGEPASCRQLPAEVLELSHGETAFKERAGIDPRRGMALEVDLVAAGRFRAAEEMVEADLEKRCSRGVGGYMAADAGLVLVGTHHHGHGIPANQTLDAPLGLAVAGKRRLLIRRNGIDIRRVE